MSNMQGTEYWHGMNLTTAGTYSTIVELRHNTFECNDFASSTNNNYVAGLVADLTSNTDIHIICNSFNHFSTNLLNNPYIMRDMFLETSNPSYIYSFGDIFDKDVENSFSYVDPSCIDPNRKNIQAHNFISVGYNANPPAPYNCFTGNVYLTGTTQTRNCALELPNFCAFLGYEPSPIEPDEPELLVDISDAQKEYINFKILNKAILTQDYNNYKIALNSIGSFDSTFMVFKELYSIVEDMVKDGRNYSSLRLAEEDALQSFIKQNKEGLAVSFAKNMLKTKIFVHHQILQATGIGNPDEATLKIYPNPANERISVVISNTQQFETLYLMDINGKLLFETKLNGLQTEYTVDVSHLPSGIYIVNVMGKTGFLTQRFVK